MNISHTSTQIPMVALVKVFNIGRGACILFYEKGLSPLSVPESRSPTHVPVSRNIHFRLPIHECPPVLASAFVNWNTAAITAAITAAGISVWAVSHSSLAISTPLLAVL